MRSSPPCRKISSSAPAFPARAFYTERDRPEMEQLVHNLEHGAIVAVPAAELPEPSEETLAKADDSFADGLRRAWNWLIQPK